MMLRSDIHNTVYGYYLLPAFGAILIVYCVFHEILTIPKSILGRVLDLVQATRGELVFIKMLDAVTTKLVE